MPVIERAGPIETAWDRAQREQPKPIAAPVLQVQVITTTPLEEVRDLRPILREYRAVLDLKYKKYSRSVKERIITIIEQTDNTLADWDRIYPDK